MAARAMWKGVVRFGDVEVPVKLYAAVEDRSVRFRLLHEADLVPVERRMLHAGTGREVPYEETRRGVETGGGVVILDEDELDAIEPDPSRDIEILRFVPADALDHRWYVRPYWLGPDDSDAAYAALAAALDGRDLEGIARWTMRNVEYRGALRLRDGRLELVTLRHAGEVVPVEALEPPSGREPSDAEREMAGRLVESLSGEWDPGAWSDDYRRRVLELVEAKAEGKVVAFEPARRKAARGTLEAALAASLEKVRKEASGG